MGLGRARRAAWRCALGVGLMLVVFGFVSGSGYAGLRGFLGFGRRGLFGGVVVLLSLPLPLSEDGGAWCLGSRSDFEISRSEEELNFEVGNWPCCLVCVSSLDDLFFRLPFLKGLRRGNFGNDLFAVELPSLELEWD